VSVNSTGSDTDDKVQKLLSIMKLGMPQGWDPVQLSGHLPAFEIYKVPDPRVRVEGLVMAPGNSAAAGTGNKAYEGVHLVYSQMYKTMGVELKFPGFFLPNDQRSLEIWHQGRRLFRCELPDVNNLCDFMWDYKRQEAVAKRYTVVARNLADNSVIQTERVYTPLPYMCAASTYSRQDIKVMDCSKVMSFPEPVVKIKSNMGFAVELEFMAKDDRLKEPLFDEFALATVKKCVDRKVAGTDFYQALSEHWNWEWEPAMVPFSAKDGVGPSESVGYMVELTSPGPPKGTNKDGVLLGDKGIRDVVRVYHVLANMGIQIGLWAQFHVHVNALSAKATGARDSAPLLTTDQIINIWTGWALFQMVIDEMQSSTNVDNLWAKPLYMDDLIARSVFEKMWKTKRLAQTSGKVLDPKFACEVFYGRGNCDGSEHGWVPPNARRQGDIDYQHGPPRYYAVNLAPLTTKGTIEIRQQAGTNDAIRAQRWINFVLAFVDVMKDAKLAQFFDGASVAEDVKDLVAFQQKASFEGLFKVLEGHVDRGSLSYYKNRQWMKAAPSFTESDPRCRW
jgi:hypothetical protein